mmetsp:Transcript_6591/g.16794  ORF Transcript_6591/g.16794 Transcript_6591/m.16794 type:complete len:93 (+) Transcript_6591:894-1172(+)
MPVDHTAGPRRAALVREGRGREPQAIRGLGATSIPIAGAGISTPDREKKRSFSSFGAGQAASDPKHLKDAFTESFLQQKGRGRTSKEASEGK